MGACTARSFSRAEASPAIAMFCKRYGPGDIVRRPATGCRRRRKGKSSFPADSTRWNGWARMTPALGNGFVDEDKRNPRPSGLPSDSQVSGSELEDLFRGVQPEMRRPKPSPDALAAALEAAQRLAAEADAEQAADDPTEESAGDSSTIVCGVCGYRNRIGNKFCGMCGVAVSQAGEPDFPLEQERPPARGLAPPRNTFTDQEPEGRLAPSRSLAQETHHYHHHYHHHYFPAGQDSMGARSPDPNRV